MKLFRNFLIAVFIFFESASSAYSQGHEISACSCTTSIQILQQNIQVIDAFIIVIQEIDEIKLTDKNGEVVGKMLNSSFMEKIAFINRDALRNVESMGRGSITISKLVSDSLLPQFHNSFVRNSGGCIEGGPREFKEYYQHWLMLKTQIKILFKDTSRAHAKYFEKSFLNNYFTYRTTNIMLAKDIHNSCARSKTSDPLLKEIKQLQDSINKSSRMISCLTKMMNQRKKLVSELNSSANNKSAADSTPPKRTFLERIGFRPTKRQMLKDIKSNIKSLILEWEKPVEMCPP